MKSRLPILWLLILPFLCIPLGCISDTQRRARQAAKEQMDTADALMEVNPDSALTILQAVDSTALHDHPAKARYSLLMARAIERTSVLTDMAVIQDAANYYEDHGTPRDKMLLCYYLGCVYHADGDNFKALEYFQRAQEYGERVKDTVLLARIAVSKGTIYYRMKKWDDYLSANQQGAKLYLHLNDSAEYYTSLLRIATAYSRVNDFDNQMRYLRKVKSEYPNMSETMWKYFYYPEALLHYQQSGNKDSLQATIDEYLINVKNIDPIDSLDFVGAYGVMNLPAQARRYMPPEDADTSFMYRKRWVGMMAYLLEVEGDAKSALAYQDRYIAMEDSVKNRNVAQGVEVLNGRLEIEKQAQQTGHQVKSSRIWLVVLAGFVLIAIILAAVFCRKSIISHKKHLKTSRDKEAISKSLTKANKELDLVNSQLDDVTKDRDSLLEELANERLRLDNLTIKMHRDRAALNKYLESFNKVLVACHDKGGYYQAIATETVNSIIASENSFLRYAEKLYTTKYPYNVAVFKRCKLTEREMQICYLIDFGMKVKQIKEFFLIGNAYNITNNIREKLGVTKSKLSLKTWLGKDLTTVPSRTEIESDEESQPDDQPAAQS